MENSLKYQVRSREIIDLVSAMRTARLILAPYFQRNLVWREGHKKDFIDTILKGFPFPQVFLARGPIDLDTMNAATCVVDGQQRLSAIREFVSGDLEVDGKRFPQMSQREREEFLKYEVPVIDFDLDVGDPRLKDIFRRLNRTFYALSTIEKIASEYSSSQFLLTARVLSGDYSSDDGSEPETDVGEELEEAEGLDGFVPEENAFLVDPGVDKAMMDWLSTNSNGEFSILIGEEKVFSFHESQRKVPLMFVLNVLSTFLGGYYNRNAKVKEFLESRNDAFEEADDIIGIFNSIASKIESLGLPDDSMWFNKANLFSLIVEMAWGCGSMHDDAGLVDNLTYFEANIPNDYRLAAREAVNNRTQRALRGNYVKGLIVAECDPD